MPINLQTFPAPPNFPKGRNMGQWYLEFFADFPHSPPLEEIGEALTATGIA